MLTNITVDLNGVYDGDVNHSVWAVGAAGSVFTWSAAGALSSKSVTAADLLSVTGDPSDGQILFTAQDGNVGRDDQTTKGPALFYNPAPDALTGIVRLASGEALAVGRSGAIVHCSQLTCEAVRGGQTANLYAVWAASDSTAWAAGQGGAIVSYNATVGAWDNIALSQPPFDIHGLTGTAASAGAPVVWAVDDMGKYFQVNGASGSIRSYSAANTDPFTAAWTDPNGNTWGVSSKNDVVNWMPSGASVKNQQYAGNPQGFSGVVGDANMGLLLTDGAGAVWRFAPIPGPTQVATAQAALLGITSDPNAPGNAWLVGDQSFIGYLSQAAMVYMIDKRYGTAGAPPLKGVWTAAGASSVWAVGAQGLVIRGQNTQWTPVSAPTANDLYAVSGAGANRVWIVGQHGTILTYRGP